MPLFFRIALVRGTLLSLAMGAISLLGMFPLSARSNSPAPARPLRALWTRSISPNADSAPAYITGVRIRGRSTSVVYVLSGNNTSNCDPSDPVRKATLYALKASNGQVLWAQSTSGASRCTTAGPVADTSGRWVYAPGLDGRIHRYNASSGKESLTGGWPERITLMPDVEKVSATPTVTKRYLYVTTSGFIGDQGHYQGHLVTVDLRTGRARVFNSLCSTIRQLLGPTSGLPNYCPQERSGFFGRGQGVVDPVNGSVYVVSGNGPWNGRTNWGDSILKLNASGNDLLDVFTPTNQKDLETEDADLGSTGPAILPAIRHGARTYHLLVQGGKGPACGSCRGVALRLLNRDNLSGQSGPGHLGGDLDDSQSPGSCEVLTAPAVWQARNGAVWVFYTNSCGVAAYTVAVRSDGSPHITRRWTVHRPGTTPVVHGGQVYVASKEAVDVYDPTTGRQLAGGHFPGDVHWEYPLVADHRVFITDESGRVSAFAVR